MGLYSLDHVETVNTTMGVKKKETRVQNKIIQATRSFNSCLYKLMRSLILLYATETSNQQSIVANKKNTWIGGKRIINR